MKKIWVIADTHFGHEKVIGYAGRPFQSAKEMDRQLIANWNRVVGKHDIVYVLGDFAFASFEYTQEILRQLKGYKVLIKGNHDSRSPRRYIEAGFQEVSCNPIVVEPGVILMHFPPTEECIIKDFIFIHGHTHEKPFYIAPYVRCVSVEQIDYTPVLLREVVDDILKQMEGR